MNIFTLSQTAPHIYKEIVNFLNLSHTQKITNNECSYIVYISLPTKFYPFLILKFYLKDDKDFLEFNSDLNLDCFEYRIPLTVEETIKYNLFHETVWHLIPELKNIPFLFEQPVINFKYCAENSFYSDSNHNYYAFNQEKVLTKSDDPYLVCLEFVQLCTLFPHHINDLNTLYNKNNIVILFDEHENIQILSLDENFFDKINSNLLTGIELNLDLIPNIKGNDNTNISEINQNVFLKWISLFKPNHYPVIYIGKNNYLNVNNDKVLSNYEIILRTIVSEINILNKACISKSCYSNFYNYYLNKNYKNQDNIQNIHHINEFKLFEYYEYITKLSEINANQLNFYLLNLYDPYMDESEFTYEHVNLNTDFEYLLLKLDMDNNTNLLVVETEFNTNNSAINVNNISLFLYECVKYNKYNRSYNLKKDLNKHFNCNDKSWLVILANKYDINHAVEFIKNRVDQPVYHLSWANLKTILYPCLEYNSINELLNKCYGNIFQPNMDNQSYEEMPIVPIKDVNNLYLISSLLFNENHQKMIMFLDLINEFNKLHCNSPIQVMCYTTKPYEDKLDFYLSHYVNKVIHNQERLVNTMHYLIKQMHES